MSEELNIHQLVEAFTNKASERYELAAKDVLISNLTELAPVELTEIGIIRLKRSINKTNNWKTLILTVLGSVSDFQMAFRWVAAIKEELLDPESSDLYFIASVKNNEISPELCTNIESGDQFCRKYVLRPGETLIEFLDRTFLANLTESKVEDEIVDPLYMAIQQTAQRLPAFTEHQQEYWRETLLSGNSGAELIDHLFKQLPISLHTNYNETSGENND